MLFFEISLWLVFIFSFVGFTVVFGNRIFYNETRFITIREIMTPMLLLILHTTSVNVSGYSWFSFATLGFSLIGLALLFYKLKTGKLILRPFLHQLFSIAFLYFGVLVILVQVGRFFKESHNIKDSKLFTIES